MKRLSHYAERVSDLSQRVIRNKTGAVAIITGLCLSIFLGGLAIAVDMASLYTERRQAQGAVDLAAMAAAADLDNAEAAAQATLAANGLANVGTVTVELGAYTPDSSVDYRARFVSGAQPYNAARVTLTKPGRTYFAKAFMNKQILIGVTGTASNSALAAFSVGSRLAAVQGGVVNALLSGLLGSNVSLSVMDYNALLSGNVSLVPFLNALGTQLNIKAGTYNTVLNSSASMHDVVTAMAAVTGNGSQSAATASLQSLLQQSALTAKVPLSQMFNLGPIGNLGIGSAPQGFGGTLNAMDMITTGAVLADGKHQLTIDLGVNIPGVADVSLDVAVGEPMQYSGWLTVAQPSAEVETTQTRLRLNIQVAGTGALAGTVIKLPLYLDLAYAQAQLADVRCSGNAGATVSIATTPGVADVWIGNTTADMTDFSHSMTVTPATLVSLPLASIAGSAHVNIGNTSATTLTFDQSDIDNGVIQTTDTRNFGQSLVTSLIGNLSLNVQAVGLGISLPSTLTGPLANTLGTVAAPLDDVVYTVLTTLGVHLGEADVLVEGASCGSGGLLAG